MYGFITADYNTLAFGSITQLCACAHLGGGLGKRNLLWIFAVFRAGGFRRKPIVPEWASLQRVAVPTVTCLSKAVTCIRPPWVPTSEDLAARR